jgi:polysaccharide deacetylase family protein (PEP-CTERM system associated)
MFSKKDNGNKAGHRRRKKILITVDVEDWFQVENLKAWVPFETWSRQELRVEKNVHQLLDIFDSIQLPPKPGQNSFSFNKVKATFFVLGWIAQRLPGLVREIHDRGHEVGSHGINHQLSNKLDGPLLAEDLNGSKKQLEDISGSQVFGFRAPSFAINAKVLKAAQHAGYTYDSSFNSFSLHGRYGKIDLSNFEVSDISYKLLENFYELPISNLKILGNAIPWGGGAYFRFIPQVIFRRGIREILSTCNSYLFYIHPWEMDPGQPRIGKPFSANSVKHYYNQKQTRNKLENLICSFSECSFMTCRDYICGLS